MTKIERGGGTEKHAIRPEASCQNCSRRVSPNLSRPLCRWCWPVVVTCERELVEKVSDLAIPAMSCDALLWRVCSLLRESGASDADDLIRALEHFFA